MQKGSLFSTYLPTLVISYTFDNSHSNRCKEVVLCGFDLYVPDDGGAKHLFMCLLVICMSFLGKYLFISSCLIRLFVFLMLSCDSFIYFGYQSHFGLSFASIFSHSLGCHFVLLVSFTLQIFSLMRSPLFIFVFITLPEKTYSKNIAKKKVKKVTICVFF